MKQMADSSKIDSDFGNKPCSSPICASSICDLAQRDVLKTDARRAQREKRRKNRVALPAELKMSLASHTAAEWAAACNRMGIRPGRY